MPKRLTSQMRLRSDVEALLTHTVSLDEIQAGFETAALYEDGCIKLCLEVP